MNGEAPMNDFRNRGETPSMIRRAIDRRGLLTFAAAVLACALVASAALFHAWVRTRVTEEGYRLSRLSAEHRELVREHERLQLQAAQLRSPHVVQILDHGVWEETPYIAMELLEGEDLSRRDRKSVV